MGGRVIICVGNRFHPGDDTGCRVHDLLAGRPLPPGVELVDGGLRGLDLLPLLEGREGVVLVDAVEGFAPPGEVVILEGERVAELAESWGHGAGLPYLLAMWPRVTPPPRPWCRVVGMAGGRGAGAWERLAAAALEVATHAPS